MAKASSGWFRESLRHSNAKRFGKAGGSYAREYVSPYSQLPKKYHYEIAYFKKPYGNKSKIVMADYEYAENEREANEFKKLIEKEPNTIKGGIYAPPTIKRLIRQRKEIKEKNKIRKFPSGTEKLMAKEWESGF